jgi:hypothetical protein
LGLNPPDSDRPQQQHLQITNLHKKLTFPNTILTTTTAISINLLPSAFCLFPVTIYDLSPRPQNWGARIFTKLGVPTTQMG